MNRTNQKVFELQKQYYDNGGTRTVEFRLEQLKKLKRIVKGNEEKIIEAIRQDLGKSAFETYLTEIGQFYNEVNLFIQKLKKWMQPKKQLPPFSHFPCKGKIEREPYGVTLIISPFNYPFGLVMTPLIGAIAGGNCAMIKPSEYTMHFYEVLCKIINDNFEQGYLYVCDPTNGKDTVDELMELPFDYVFFTGSTKVGSIIMEKAAKHLTPVTLELGGKSPCIVTEEADIKMAAKRIVWGKMVNAGQTCVAPDYIWVQDTVKEKLLKELKRQIIKQYGEEPMKNPDFCRMINAQAVKRMEGYLEDGTVYYGGKYDIEKHYFDPTILTDVSLDAQVMSEEIFGPILPVITFQYTDMVVEYLKQHPKPLALYIFTENRDEAAYLMEHISSGDVMINDTILHVATTTFPFGGVGKSGMGKYHGIYSLETFTHERTVMERKTWGEFSLRFAPYKNKLDFFKKLMK